MIKKILKKIFKSISYILFLKIYGKIDGPIKGDNNKKIKIELIEFDKNVKYKVYKILNGRLYTDRIHDTAVISENKIIEGASFQIRNNNSSSTINNIVLKKGTQRRLRKLKGTVLSLLTGGAGNNNYWHWIYDVLPRLKLCEKVKNLNEIDYFILPSLEKKFQMETLNALGIKNERLLSSVKFRHIESKELIVTEHPYIFTNNSHNDVQNIPEWIISWLKDKFLSNLKKTENNFPKNIYIDRSDAISNSTQSREVINESEIRDFLIRKNFKIIKLSDLSFHNQINYFNNADFIIGLHGAGFSNLSFCKPKTKILEFRTNTTGLMFENLAKKNNLNFKAIISSPESHGYAAQLGRIRISMNELNEKIRDI